jgi:hypothetical protein
VRDAEDLKDLKREYMELVRQDGAVAAELKPFKQSLLEANRRHRLEVARMYARMISRIEGKMARRR